MAFDVESLQKEKKKCEKFQNIPDSMMNGMVWVRRKVEYFAFQVQSAPCLIILITVSDGDELQTGSTESKKEPAA